LLRFRMCCAYYIYHERIHVGTGRVAEGREGVKSGRRGGGSPPQ